VCLLTVNPSTSATAARHNSNQTASRQSSAEVVGCCLPIAFASLINVVQKIFIA